MPPNNEHAHCAHTGCAGDIEAAAPLWLSLHSDGLWSLFGVGDEVADIACTEGHDNATAVLRKSLSAALDELLPGSTLDGSAPDPEDNTES